VNAPNDADASYIEGSDGQNEQYSLAASGIPAGSVINSVAVLARVRKLVTNGLCYTNVYIGASSSTQYGFSATSTSYGDKLSTAFGRPGGGAWVLADLASTEIKLMKSAGGDVRCTSLWLVVDYTAPAPVIDTGAFLQLF